MPKFVITVFFILTLLGGAALYIFLKIDPVSKFVVFGFLLLLWLILGMLMSLPLSYLAGKEKENKVKNEVLRDIYRANLRRGLIISFAISSFMALRILGIFSPANLLIVISALFIIELFFSYRQC